MNKLRILSGFEFGYLAGAIEWVDRGQKPIATCGARQLSLPEVAFLKQDLRRALSIPAAHGRIGGFVLRQTDRWFLWGVYKYRWALDALLYLYLERDHPAWIAGLVFGYSPDAIAKHLQESCTTRSASRSAGSRTSDKMEIVGPSLRQRNRRIPYMRRRRFP